MAMDLANIYRKTFLAHQPAIAGNLHLEPEENTNLAQLLDAQVIVDGSLISQLINADVNSRGEMVVKNIIARNNLDVYEKFLAVWLLINQSAANEFATKLDNVLRGWGLRRHQPTTASPAPPPTATAANLDPARDPPPPSDPTGFKWLKSWQDAMNKKRVDLKRGFQKFDAEMFDTLMQNNVITPEQVVSITAENQPYNKAGIMYGALEQREPSTIMRFIEILRNNDNTRLLAEEVQKTYNSAMQEAKK